METTGSDEQWQLGYLAAAALIVLFKAWTGWRVGLVRQVLGLVAAATAVVCGIWFGGALTPKLRIAFTYPDRIVSVIGGLVIGVAVFVVLSLLNALLFKKTSDQSVALVRWGYGLNGAALGAVYGLFLVGTVTIGIRVLGSIGEAQLALRQAPREQPAHSASEAALVGVARLKRAIDHGPAGMLLRELDPVPSSVYVKLSKLSMVAANPQALERFAEYPAARPLLQLPKIAALQRDGELMRAVADRHFAAVLTNPRVIAALNDPEVTARLEEFDWEKALDYALHKPDKGPPRP